MSEGHSTGARVLETEKPVTAHRLPITAHRSPLTDHRSPITDHENYPRLLHLGLNSVRVKPMKRYALRATKIAAGVGCLVLGVIGLFLPFLQGILFLIIGLTLLSQESELVRRTVVRLRRYVPIHRVAQGDDADDR
jgi:hypothetical protein